MATATQYKSIDPHHAERLADNIMEVLTQNAARLRLHRREDDAAPPFWARPALRGQLVNAVVSPWAAQLSAAEQEALVDDIIEVIASVIGAHQAGNRPNCYCDVLIGDRRFTFHAGQDGSISQQC